MVEPGRTFDFEQLLHRVPYLERALCQRLTNGPPSQSEIQTLINQLMSFEAPFEISPEDTQFLLQFLYSILTISPDIWQSVTERPQIMDSVTPLIVDMLTEEFEMYQKLPFRPIIDYCFSDRSQDWKEQVQVGINDVLGVLYIDSPIKHHIDLSANTRVQGFAELHGSIARRIAGGTHRAFSTAQSLLQHVYHSLPDDTNDRVRQSFETFAGGPHDMDIRIFPRDMDALFETINQKLKFYNPDKIHAHLLQINDTLRVIGIYMKPTDEPPFEIHIAPFPTEVEMEEEYRMGHHLTSKRNVSFPFARNPRSGEFVLTPPIDWTPGSRELFPRIEDLLVSLTMPSKIHKPSYPHFNLALYAGLSLIRHELLWPSRSSVKIDPVTVHEYSQNLSMHRSKLKGTEIPLPPEFRIQEIMREAVLILTIDKDQSMKMMKDLGILDALDIPAILRDEIDSMSNEEFREKVANDPSFAVVIAEAFDTSDLYSK